MAAQAARKGRTQWPTPEIGFSRGKLWGGGGGRNQATSWWVMVIVEDEDPFRGVEIVLSLSRAKPAGPTKSRPRRAQSNPLTYNILLMYGVVYAVSQSPRVIRVFLVVLTSLLCYDQFSEAGGTDLLHPISESFGRFFLPPPSGAVTCVEIRVSAIRFNEGGGAHP
ncbi:hypothetical protein BO78DRAFT_80603 [Aspergillus sclerotiicarbonarius CBS 121057]|uniref:Uncharacterized protein n=1 Tax=Aspergillus sclerotiicarbonarius (strain CBS 121057 / IBT 28362) TaxID=1448318 RepID=A0A319EMX1_ASPSB|nr:hypothetical protein BO78DRAFT_80603 [Aspergillus sclerotiicarbonarius CBS 121057]